MAITNSTAMAKIIAKAWTDPAYKARLLKEPAKVARAEGIKVPKGARVHIHENSKKNMHLVLPQKPAAALDEDSLNQQAGIHGVHMLYTCSS
jgi:hypothetical protein